MFPMEIGGNRISQKIIVMTGSIQIYTCARKITWPSSYKNKQLIKL